MIGKKGSMAIQIHMVMNFTILLCLKIIMWK